MLIKMLLLFRVNSLHKKCNLSLITQKRLKELTYGKVWRMMQTLISFVSKMRNTVTLLTSCVKKIVLSVKEIALKDIMFFSFKYTHMFLSSFFAITGHF